MNPPRTWNRAGLLRDLQVRMNEFIAQHVAKGDQVVDYGCGDMPYRPLFEIAGARYVGCDIEGECDVRIEPDEPVPLPEGQADVVLSIQVLEHVWESKNYLSEAYRLLKPGGFFCLTTRGMWWYHAHPDDFHRWTRVGLERTLIEAGFEVVKTVPIMNIVNFANFILAEMLGRGLCCIPLLGRVLKSVLNLLLLWSYPVLGKIVPDHVSKDASAVYMIVARRPSP